MANKLPPPNKVEASESEVIDPHLRITFPLPNEDGWDSWSSGHRDLYINNLSVELKYDGQTFISDSRQFSAANFNETPAPFNLGSLSDTQSYYNTTPHYLTLYIDFPDSNYHQHTKPLWTVTIKIDEHVVSNYNGTLIPNQPARTS